MLKERLQNIPLGVKAAVVYTMASVFSRGLSMITVPIFTRIMSTSEIGMVNLYNSCRTNFKCFRSNDDKQNGGK